jgi:hypothetical protein
VDFLKELWRNVEDADTSDDLFWRQFPILRRVARIAHAHMEKERALPAGGGAGW